MHGLYTYYLYVLVNPKETSPVIVRLSVAIMNNFIPRLLLYRTPHLARRKIKCHSYPVLVDMIIGIIAIGIISDVSATFLKQKARNGDASDDETVEVLAPLAPPSAAPESPRKSAESPVIDVELE